MKQVIFFSLIMVMGTMDAKTIVMRHGQSTHNVELFYNSDPSHPNHKPSHLTQKGKEQVRATAQKLLDQGITKDTVAIAYVSPLDRTQETARVLVEMGVIAPESIRLEKRLLEINMGDCEGHPHSDFSHHRSDHSQAEKYHGETMEQITQRMQGLLSELKEKHLDTQKHILLVSHETPSTVLIDLCLGKKVALETAGFCFLN